MTGNVVINIYCILSCGDVSFARILSLPRHHSLARFYMLGYSNYNVTSTFYISTMAAGPQITNIPPPASFNILFNNVQSLRRRLVTGELEAEWNDYPILFLSETWLNPNISSEDLQLSGYALPERRDRLTDAYGGCVCILEMIYHTIEETTWKRKILN